MLRKFLCHIFLFLQRKEQLLTSKWILGSLVVLLNLQRVLVDLLQLLCTETANCTWMRYYKLLQDLTEEERERTTSLTHRGLWQKALINAPAWACAIPGQPYRAYSDACDIGIAYILCIPEGTTCRSTDSQNFQSFGVANFDGQTKNLNWTLEVAWRANINEALNIWVNHLPGFRFY